MIGPEAEAESFLEQALSAATDERARAFLLGVLGDLYKAMARFDQALLAYERAVALLPADASLLVRLGALLVQRGDLDRAAAALERARQEDPTNALACLELGRLQIRKAEYAAARTSLECTVRSDPSSLEGHYMLWTVYRKLGQQQMAERTLNTRLAP